MCLQAFESARKAQEKKQARVEAFNQQQEHSVKVAIRNMLDGTGLHPDGFELLHRIHQNNLRQPARADGLKHSKSKDDMSVIIDFVFSHAVFTRNGLDDEWIDAALASFFALKEAHRLLIEEGEVAAAELHLQNPNTLKSLSYVCKVEYDYDFDDSANGVMRRWFTTKLIQIERWLYKRILHPVFFSKLSSLEEKHFGLFYPSQMDSTDLNSIVQQPSNSFLFRGQVGEKEEWLACLDIVDDALRQEALVPTGELGGACDECAAAAPVAEGVIPLQEQVALAPMEEEGEELAGARDESEMAPAAP